MTISLAALTASALADALTAQVDLGSGAGTLKVYTGAKPASPDDTATGTLLVTFTLTDPAVAAAVAGVATWDMGGSGIAATTVAAGDTGWFRVADSTGAAVFDGTAGATADNDLVFDAASWLSGESVTLSAGTTTEPVG